MENYDQFVIEIQTFEIKVIERYITNNGYYIDEYTPEEIPNMDFKKAWYLDLSHYHQKKSDYENDLMRLQQLALDEILLFTKTCIF